MMRRYRVWIFGVFFIPLVFFCYIFYKIELSPFGEIDINLPKVRPRINILLWPWNENEPIEDHWAGFGSNLSLPNYLGQEVHKKCDIKCTITTNMSLLPYADAVLFEAVPQDPKHVWEWLRVPLQLPQKRPHQAWVNFAVNSPEQYPLLKQRGYTVLHDINMTLNQNPGERNVPFTLFCNWGGGTQDDFLKKPPQRDPQKFAVFISDNCAIGGARNRTAYVKELMSYIPIDSYGECLHNKEFPHDIQEALTNDHGHGIKLLVDLLSKYKFVLAFENVNMTDYVTDKLVLALKSGSLPVYMGAPNIDNWIPGDKSIIRTDSFSSPKALANFLKELDTSDQEYAKYFTWKQSGLSKNFVDKMNKCIYNNADCRLCEAVARYQLNMKPNYLGDSHIKRILLDKSNALSFDGSSSYIEIPDSSEFRLSDAFTINAWVYMDSHPADYRIVDKNTAGTIDGYSMDILNKNDRGFLRLCAAAGCWTGLKPLFGNTWYHVSVVFISSNYGEKTKELAGVFFYVNGEVDYQVPFPVPMFGLKAVRKNTLPLRIGRAAVGGNYWKGTIDDVSIWNIPLSQDRIRRLMFERIGGKEEGLVGYWSFNEGEGTKTADHSTNRKDANLYNTKWVPQEKKDLILNDCV